MTGSKLFLYPLLPLLLLLLFPLFLLLLRPLSSISKLFHALICSQKITPFLNFLSALLKDGWGAAWLWLLPTTIFKASCQDDCSNLSVALKKRLAAGCYGIFPRPESSSSPSPPPNHAKDGSSSWNGEASSLSTIVMLANCIRLLPHRCSSWYHCQRLLPSQLP